MNEPGFVWFTVALLVLALAGAGWLFLRDRRARADASLREAALDAHADAMLLAAKDGTVLYANRAWRDRIAGNVGVGIAALEPVLDRDGENRQIFVRLRAAAAAGDPDEGEIALRSAEGHKLWCRLGVRLAPSAGEGAVLWSLADYDERNALESALEAEQARLVGFLDEFPIGFFSVDQDGRFVHANSTFAGWVARTPEDLSSGSVRLHDLLPDEEAKAGPPWSTQGAAGEGCGEALFMAADGRRFLTLCAETAIIEGGNARTRTLVRDLSAERDLASALRHSEERFHRFFDEAPVGIAIVDPEGRITECSTAFTRMVDAAPEATARTALWDYVIDDDRDRLRQWIADAVTGGDTAPLQLTLRAPGEVVASFFARRIEAEDGAPAGVVVHVLDQTELRNMENQFIQSQKMELVGQLAGGVAHDFNNLLTAMIGFCDLLLQRHSPKDQSFADIMQIKQNANRAANLVRQLLAFSRQQTLQPKVLNITDVLAELSHLLRRLIGADIELKLVHARDLWPVRVDQSQLEQVIINLAVNARDAVEGGGTLTIRTFNLPQTGATDARHRTSLPAGEYVVMEVADTGQGIPRHIQDKIFEPFFTTKEVGSGTGLGLSTVYGIIRQTGGHIFVDSVEGEGARFTIYLPRHEITAVEAREEAEAAAEIAAESKRDLTGIGTVMLVEDEDAVRMFGARALRNKGYTVVEAASGEEALAVLADPGTGAIDLLITDVVMPGLDGPAMIRKVRETLPDLKVVFISGYTEDSFRKRLGVSEDIHFLPKPFTLQQLASKVKEIMEDEAA